MIRALILTLAVLSSPVTVLGQLHRESLFGMDIPFRRWTWQTDRDYLDAPFLGRFAIPSDAAKLRFAFGSDTTDIILVIDHGRSKIHWLRISADPTRRTLEHLGTYGALGNEPAQFLNLLSLAVATTTPLYDPSTDHIFVGDRTNGAIIKLNFEFHPSSPQSDTILWESSTYVDSTFAPTDLEYVDYGTGNINDNRLFALDDMGSRLAVLSHEGDLLQLIDLYDPADTAWHIYNGSTYKLNPNGSVTFYFADRNLTNVRRYLYSAAGEFTYVNEINLGDRMETSLADVIYSERFGLWAIESRGPHLYKLAENLSRVLFEVSGEQFNPRSLFQLQKICVFPERLVVFEEMGDETGLLTFAFNPPQGKRDVEDDAIVPFKFELSQNYPNPFNPNTMINFEIPQSGWVSLEIFNILGQKVKTLIDDYRTAGRHSILWDGTNSSGKSVSTGVYFTRLASAGNSEIKKMLLLR